MARILIADDEGDFRRSLAETLQEAKHDVTECADADEAEARLLKEAYDVLITDLRMPGRNGMTLLREAAARRPDCVRIVMTAYASLDTAIEALRIGAHDYLIKPVNLDAVLHKVELFLKQQSTQAENQFLRKTVESSLSTSGLIGGSAAMNGVRRLIARVAPTDSTVLISGETGTGKEVAARAVHQAGARAERPFIAVNCGSIAETLLESELFGYLRGAFTGAERDKKGLFEVAADGTLFLDEIGEMPLALQPKILRALESREILRLGSTTPTRVSARIIAATNRNLPRMVEKGLFRQDLFYRLNVVEIALPPLRNHPEDIRELADSLIRRSCRTLNRPIPALDPETFAALERYAWPGNVRELGNVLERTLILTDGSRITPADLHGLGSQEQTPTPDDLKAARQAFERTHIQRTIARHDGDKRRAAQALGIDLSSLYRKMEEA